MTSSLMQVSWVRATLLPGKDVALAERDILEAGRALLARHPDVGAVVLECTNIPPYAGALRDALKVPVTTCTR